MVKVVSYHCRWYCETLNIAQQTNWNIWISREAVKFLRPLGSSRDNDKTMSVADHQRRQRLSLDASTSAEAAWNRRHRGRHYRWCFNCRRQRRLLFVLMLMNTSLRVTVKLVAVICCLYAWLIQLQCLLSFGTLQDNRASKSFTRHTDWWLIVATLNTFTICSVACSGLIPTNAQQNWWSVAHGTYVCNHNVIIDIISFLREDRASLKW